MKYTLKVFAIICFFLQNNSYAQQMVQTPHQAYLLEENKELFINKSLKDLLKEIKPEIKTAHVFNNETSSLFGFRFTTLAQQKIGEGAIQDRVTLFVQVKEFIPWNWDERPKGSEFNWTPNDAQKFADFIVLDIGVAATSQD